MEKKMNKNEDMIDNLLKKLGIGDIKLSIVGKLKLAMLKTYLKSVLPDNFSPVFEEKEVKYKFSGNIRYRGFFAKDVHIILFEKEIRDIFNKGGWKIEIPATVRVNVRTKEGWFVKWFGLLNIGRWKSAYFDKNWDPISKLPSRLRDGYISVWEDEREESPFGKKAKYREAEIFRKTR